MPASTGPHVHSVLAAALDSPELLENWRHDPQRLARVQIAPETLDLETLWKFAGFACKIRHNDVRKEIPLTFRLMSLLKVDLSVFAYYARSAAELRDAGVKSTEAKLNSLLEFFRNWLNLAQDEHALVWTMASHEETLCRLRRLAPSDPTPSSQPALEQLTVRSVPQIAGKLIVRKMPYEPRFIERALHQGQLDLARLNRGEYILGYWAAPLTNQKQIIPLDPTGSYLLSLVNGQSSVEAMLDRIGISREDVASQHQVLEYFGQLATLGLVTASTAPCT
jgi:hypothetical protein